MCQDKRCPYNWSKSFTSYTVDDWLCLNTAKWLCQWSTLKMESFSAQLRTSHGHGHLQIFRYSHDVVIFLSYLKYLRRSGRFSPLKSCKFARIFQLVEDHFCTSKYFGARINSLPLKSSVSECMIFYGLEQLPSEPFVGIFRTELN